MRGLVTLVVAASVSSVPSAAQASYSATAAGSAKAAAVLLATPAGPGVTVTGIPIVSCSITITWPAPPAGQQLAIVRFIGATPTTLVANRTSAGSTSETILLSLLFGGDPSYVIRTSLVAASSWTQDSPAVVATAC